MSFDVAILGGDENRKYLDFWPFIAYSYRTIFNVPTILALVTQREREDPLVRELERHGEVVLYKPVDGFPIASQAKMARYRAASEQDNRVCFIDDLDEIPIDKQWHLDRTNKRAPGSMLLVGGEIYAREYPGQVPASMMTAEGSVFLKLFRDSASALQWFKWLHTLSVSDTDHTNIKLDTFSDEALIKILREHHPVPETHVERGYVVGRDTIDRAYWPFDRARLEVGHYVAAHTARPYRQFKEGNDVIFDYIRRRYDGAPLPASLPEVL